MAEEVRITLKVDGKTGVLTTGTKKVQKLGREVERTGKKVKATQGAFAGLAGSVGSFLGFAVVAQLFRVATDEAARFEEAQDNLAASLAATGELSQESLADLTAYARQIEETTKVSQTSALEQLTLAKAFVNTKEEAKELTAAALDFSVAAKLNFEEALRRLGRATQGSAADLANFVPEVRTLTREQLRAGEATRLTAAAFEGRAAAAADNLGGRFTILANRVRRAGREFAEDLTPSINEAIASIESAIPFISRVGAAVGAVLTTIIAGVTLVVKTVVNAFRTISSIQDNFFKAILAALSGNLTEARALLGKARGDAGKGLRTLVDDATVANKSISGAWKRASDRILGIQKDTQVKLTDEQRKGKDARVFLTDDEIRQKKALLDQELKNIQTQLQADLDQRNISRQQRLEMIRIAEAEERELVRAAREEGVLQADETATKLIDIEARRGSERRRIENETNEEIVKANEAWAAKINNTSARMADLGRKTFDKLGDAVGKSFADSIVEGKNFKESFTAMWKDIKRQVIAAIASMIVKLIALKVAQMALGGFFGGAAVAAAEGGRFPSLSRGKPIRGLAGGGRTSGPEVAVIGEGPDDETVVPDSQAAGFGLGVLAAKGARLPAKLRKKGLDQLSRPSSSGMNVTFGDINLNFTGPVNLDNPQEIDTILEGVARRLKDKVEIAVRAARLIGDTNDEESDRTV